MWLLPGPSAAAAAEEAGQPPSLQLAWDALALGDARHGQVLQNLLLQHLQRAQAVYAARGDLPTDDRGLTGTLAVALPTDVVRLLQYSSAAEGMLFHGLSGAGSLLQTLYDFCPEVLRVSRLVGTFEQRCAQGLRLLEVKAAGLRGEQEEDAPSSSDERLLGDELQQLLRLERWSFDEVALLLWQQVSTQHGQGGAQLARELAAHTQALTDLSQVRGEGPG